MILFRRGATATCFEDSCSHLSLGIATGCIKEGVITCPHHGFRYDLASGECLTAPVVRLKSHEVRVTGSTIELKLAG